MTSDWKPYNYHSFENKRYHITVIILLKSQIKLNTMVKTKRLAHLASVCWSGSSSNPAKLLSVSPSKQLSLLLRTSWPQEMKAGATGHELCVSRTDFVYINGSLSLRINIVGKEEDGMEENDLNFVIKLFETCDKEWIMQKHVTVLYSGLQNGNPEAVFFYEQSMVPDHAGQQWQNTPIH